MIVIQTTTICREYEVDAEHIGEAIKLIDKGAFEVRSVDTVEEYVADGETINIWVK